jgi:hypothetical protein
LTTSKPLIVGLAALSAVLAATSITLGIILYRQQRFVPTSGNSPYVMFDTETAQACWSGPPTLTANAPPKASGNNAFNWNDFPTVGQGKTNNPPNLPFCKDLK